MIEVAKVLRDVGNVGSSNEKLYILQKNADLPNLKDILHFIYNPYCRTGISEAKFTKVKALCSSMLKQGPAEHLITCQMAIKYFKAHTTGSDADISYAAQFLASAVHTYGAATADGQLVMDLVKAIITQDLKIGVNVTTLNKAYGDNFIPKVGCMLGTLFGDVGATKVKWPCIVTEKLDGIRRILIKEDGVCRAYSRSGHEDTGLVDIIKEAKYLPNNTVYDGELLAIGNFKDSIAQRQASNSIANSKGNKTGLTFNVFDMIPLEDFYAGKSADNALNRKILLGATFMDTSIELLTDKAPELIAAFGIYRDLEYIRPVPILGLVNSITEVDPIVANIWARGGEGVMLNTVSGLYEIKRSKQLLKVKHTEEYVLTVVDFVEGTGKYEDSLGALVVDYKGSYVGVGSGFTDEQRQHIWYNQNFYIGRKIEVETFGESKNASGGISLNCPIFKRFVGDIE